MALAEPIKNAPEFVHEAIDILKTFSKGKGGGSPEDEMPTKLVGDIKIDGDKAHGRVETAKGEDDIHFAREGGVWKIDMMPMLEKGW
jgi:hypothetical protein